MRLRYLLVLACGLLAGCTAAQLANYDKLVGGTPLPATTRPSTQPGGPDVVVQPTKLDATFHLIQDASNVTAPVVASAPIGPWAPIAGGAIGLLGTLAGLLVKWNADKAAKLSTAQANLDLAHGIIGAAAAPVAALVQQVTDNQVVATDVTKMSQIAPAVLDLLAHPAAAAAVAAVALPQKMTS